MIESIPKNNKSSQGFTIIEVMIVLAIAGMIMMIVFLAVPALQRNARNNQRKRDASIMVILLHEYITNSGGQLPGDCSGNPGPNCDTVFLQEGDFSYYETKNVSFKFRSDTNNDGFPAYNGPGNIEWVTTANYYKCQTDASGNETAVHTGAGYKNIVLLYELETATGQPKKKCQDF